MADTYLQLLASCGVHVDPVQFKDLYPWQHKDVAQETPDRLPDTPIAYERDTYAEPLPIFSSDQLDLDIPEQYGYNEYIVYESRETARPIALDPSDWGRVRKTHKHIYSRPYIFRWTLYHTLGFMGGPFDASFLAELKAHIGGDGAVNRPDVYIKVRDALRAAKLQPLYLSIPAIIRSMGGASWPHPPDHTMNSVQRMFTRVHHAFQHKHLDLKRKRFPKMLFVCLAILDLHGVTPPYTIPWTYTELHNKQLSALFTQLNTTDA
ncbi:uncharacterized protein SPPG_00922 [Spizellomyces punctatus DAOM BR117]|uniref:Uncharacterized protein n=1 Tax=Spizellomyces punctatus (strain DAOM BR117) TaxID=645134 RepID=A0A0L0HQU0_SPIPD|nr:uncharacterized protein SPPG_00922 [Spizellomyces punctatus DAOM BR117]KND03438.1 hypothetical protein SPPG_00922 [Spizellomyces punctatus DAOM BR117]|eukprot:XP_016611477.1 hypothetical protein SPPG_00922 [Spizellomyces punctatus DAOM BR117]